jgi:hypothetical protein
MSVRLQIAQQFVLHTSDARESHVTSRHTYQCGQLARHAYDVIKRQHAHALARRRTPWHQCVCVAWEQAHARVCVQHVSVYVTRTPSQLARLCDNFTKRYTRQQHRTQHSRASARPISKRKRTRASCMHRHTVCGTRCCPSHRTARVVCTRRRLCPPAVRCAHHPARDVRSVHAVRSVDSDAAA